jgi:hypothetical protein
MNIRKICSAIILCAVAITATAQSFESLKRSKGKSTLYTTVEKVLNGQMPASAAANEVSTSTLLTEPYNGKTPIYLVLDYIAHTPKTKCEEAEKLLDAFLANKSFDVNQRYSSLMPPLAYLIRENYDFLDEKFSSNYISDHVLRKLIEAGASVNTYNTDGSSLMSFAIVTNNQYLQNYFAESGANIHHTDNTGQDDLYKIIASGNLDLLKKYMNNGQAKIDIHTLKNEPSSFAQYKQMYDYLAEHCGKQANSYDDMKLYRKRFNLRKDVVEAKYQNLAQNEIDAIKTFHDIVKIESRYPDLQFILKAKLDYYHNDCQKLAPICQQARKSAAAKQVNLNGSNTVTDFINLYGKYNYDPDNKLPEARQTADYFQVCNALNLQLRNSYWNYGRPPKYSEEGHPRIINDAIHLCGSQAAPFTAFYDYAKPLLETKNSELQTRLSDSYREYRYAYEDYLVMRRNLIEDIQKMSGEEVLAKIKYISEKWSEGRVVDTDDDFLDHKWVTFKDGEDFRVYWRFKNSDHEFYSYYTLHSIKWGNGRIDNENRFATVEDAIIYEYKRLKINKIEFDYPE